MNYIGRQKRPYQIPCGGSPASPEEWLGITNEICGCSPFQNYQPGQKVAVWKNTTDLHAQNAGNESTVDGTTGKSNISPLCSIDGVSTSFPPCSAGFDTCGTPYDGTNYTASPLKKGPWGSHPPVNTFAETTDTFDFSKCNETGVQTPVYSHRFWHGNPGLINSQSSCPNTGCGSGIDQGGGLNFNGDPSYKEWRAYDAAPWGSKWLTLAFKYTSTNETLSITRPFKDNAGTSYSTTTEFIYSATVSGTLTIDKNSGRITMTSPVKTEIRTINVSGSQVNLVQITDKNGNAPGSHSGDAGQHDGNGLAPGQPGYTPPGVDYIPTYGNPTPPGPGDPAPGQVVAIPGGTTFSSIADYQAWTVTRGGAFALLTEDLLQTQISRADAAGIFDWLKAISICGGRIYLPGRYIPADPTTYNGFILQYHDFDNYDGYVNPQFPNAAYVQKFLGNFLGGDSSQFLPPQQDGFNDYTTTYTNTPSVSLDNTNFSLTWDITNTSVGKSGTSVAGNASSGSLHINFEIHLTDENKAVDVVADALAIKAPWDKTNLKLMPLLPPTNGVGILVERNEFQNDVSIGHLFIADPTDYTDTSAAPQDGSILGLPLGLNSTDDPSLAAIDYPEDYFFADYKNMVEACTTTRGTRQWYVESFGGWRSAASDENGVPVQIAPRATRWTNGRQSAGLPIGAFIRCYNQDVPEVTAVGGSDIWIGDWLETGVILPSYNHARPYGLDRALVDERRIGGIGAAGSFDGTTVVLTYAMEGLPVVGETAFIYGTSNDGIYTIASVTDNANFTVEFVSAIPSWFPTYWDTGETSDDGSGIVGILRFPDCPAFGGRLAVSGITDDGTLRHVTLAAATDVPIDLPIDFCVGTETSDEIIMTAVAGGTNQTVTVISPTEFTTTMTLAQLAGVNFIVPYGALPTDPAVAGVKHWYWADTQPKNNAVKMEWTKSTLINGEAARLSGVTDCSGSLAEEPTPDSGWLSFSATDFCKSFLPQTPFKITVSDAGDPPAGTGVRFWFSSIQPIDEQYGTYQIFEIVQASTDALWQSPHTSMWKLSGGDPAASPVTSPTCVPYVEMRATLPVAGATGTETAPAPPVSYIPISPITDESFGATPPLKSNIGTGPDTPIQAVLPGGIEEGC